MVADVVLGIIKHPYGQICLSFFPASGKYHVAGQRLQSSLLVESSLKQLVIRHGSLSSRLTSPYARKESPRRPPRSYLRA